ncbi:hypothetical protein [Methylobacterium sp. Leaf118]|uniref:hypothetical protein n=1 Tax=Methylobacterium sp. Leaf118 TaxID=2876562 RepID=UPI001E391637|nr:hypothetical protein [Methylobacterium sp. Leaf118]
MNRDHDTEAEGDGTRSEPEVEEFMARFIADLEQQQHEQHGEPGSNPGAGGDPMQRRPGGRPEDGDRGRQDDGAPLELAPEGQPSAPPRQAPVDRPPEPDQPTARRIASE